VRGQLRHRKGLRERHHRRGGALHHRHRLRARLGQSRSRPARKLPYSVGIIGAGPGGLAAAEELRRRGYQVHVYDRHDRVGGLLIYGIPGFKLEKDIVLRRWKCWRKAASNFHLGVDIGGDVTFAELRARHDAVLVATGVYQPREIGGPGAGLPGIVPALDYLTVQPQGPGRRGAGFR
jgi:glutamate synthase (NADPH/NADH) small chain